MHTGRFTLVPGLRFSYSGLSGQRALAPRLRVRYGLPHRTALTLATGIYHQTPLNRYVVAHPDNRSLRAERSAHLIGGVTHQLSDDLTATVEAYYKRLDDLIIPAGAGGSGLTNHGTGWSTGLDAILRRRFTGRFHGEVTYSFLVSRRDDHDGMGEHDAPFSQPHNFAARFGYELSDRWFVSSRFRYAAGRPKDRFIVHENVLGDPDRRRYSRDRRAKRGTRPRLPPAQRAAGLPQAVRPGRPDHLSRAGQHLQPIQYLRGALLRADGGGAPDRVRIHGKRGIQAGALNDSAAVREVLDGLFDHRNQE